MSQFDSTPIESSGMVRNGQKLQYRATYLEPGGVKVRYTVSLDTSYPKMQSHAKAEVWHVDRVEWTTMDAPFAAEWVTEGSHGYGSTAAEEADVLAVVEAMRGRVVALLTSAS